MMKLEIKNLYAKNSYEKHTKMAAKSMPNDKIITCTC